MELPQWCTPLPDAERMREIDRWAMEDGGVASLQLMERAGEAVAAAVRRIRPDGRVAVLCGKGNNGGDGLVLARLLRDEGRAVDVLLLGDPGELRGDAAENLARLPGSAPEPLLDGAELSAPSRSALKRAAVAVDALLGTGFHGEPRPDVAAGIEALADLRAPVIAVDVPSGVDASTGVVAGAAVRACCTVTFDSGKPGLCIAPGKGHAGDVEVVDIGIPRGAPRHAQVGLIADEALSLLPRRAAGSTKFTSGRVIVVGGSSGLAGAPRMAGEAAMRAGAGYVTACIPGSLQPIFAAGPRPELMSRAMPESDGGLAPEAVRPALELADAAGAVALGPGLGRSEDAVRFARELARRTKAPLVLDADGLNAHAGELHELAAREAPTVLTPHAGELGRLLGLDSREIDAQRLRHVRAAAEASGAVVLLKGDDTLVAEPGGAVAVSAGGSAALATAGTGDVLTGVVAALLAHARGLSAFEAAALGVLLHARAGRIAAEREGCEESVIASDVIAALGAARARRS